MFVALFHERLLEVRRVLDAVGEDPKISLPGRLLGSIIPI